MENLLKVVLRKEKASVILQNKLVEDRLVFRLVDFMDMNGNFKSLFICYNLEFVFSETLKLIGKIDSNSLTDRLRASMKVYSSKEEYLEDKLELNKEYIDYKFSEFEDEIANKLLDLSSDLFKVRSVTVSWFPIVTVIVNYNCKAKRQEPIVVLPGRLNYIAKCDKPLLDFKIKIMELLTDYRLEGD